MANTLIKSYGESSSNPEATVRPSVQLLMRLQEVIDRLSKLNEVASDKMEPISSQDTAKGECRAHPHRGDFGPFYDRAHELLNGIDERLDRYEAIIRMANV